MTDAKMSIVESSSDAQTLIEPVSHPVAVFRTMRKAAAATERRAAELFRRASLSVRASSRALLARVADICKARGDSTKSVAERVRVVGHVRRRACARAQGHDGHAREYERGGDERARSPTLLRAEEERRDGVGHERLKVYVDGDGARRDPFERPGVEVVSADGRDEDDVRDREPDLPADA